MTLRGWGLALRDAARSMTQSTLMSLASIATVAASLLVLAVVLLLAVNLEFMATSVEQQIEIKVYLCAQEEIEASKPNCPTEEPTAAQKQALVEQATQLPGVRQVTFVSREESLARMKEQFGEQKDILEGFDGDNPLRDSLEVKATEPDQVRSIAQSLIVLPGVSGVATGQEYVDKLLAFTQAIRVGGIGLVLLLVIATVLTISNTIRLSVYARRREIAIMKLVGATDWHIRRPFMLEGIFLGAFGAMLSMGLIGLGYQRFVQYVYDNIAFLPVVSPDEVVLSLTFVVLTLGTVLGAIGSLLSLRRFLKV